MTDRHELLIQMRDSLADLYDDQTSARRVIDDAGLDAARIERADRALNFWHSILREAERQGKIDELLALASREYPARTDLTELREEYRALTVPKKAPMVTPQEPVRAQPIATASARKVPWLWVAVGLLAVAVVVVLVIRGGIPRAAPAQVAGMSGSATRTASPPTEMVATDVPAAAPSLAPITAPQVALVGCFSDYFNGMTKARMANLEPGTNDFDLPWIDLALAEPVGFMFTLDGQPLGAMRFRFVRTNGFYRTESVVDSQCRKIEDYANASRGGNKNILQQWDTLRMTLNDQDYDLRMGNWAPEQEVIRVDFGEAPPP